MCYTSGVYFSLKCVIRLSRIDCTHIRCVVVYAVKKTRLEVCTMSNAARTR